VNPSRPNDLLYLFTTPDLSAQEIINIYKLRWNIETDLRSLKRTVGLDQLSFSFVRTVVESGFARTGHSQERERIPTMARSYVALCRSR
jgi:hypothetical protein